MDERIKQIIALLTQEYPNSKTRLIFDDNYQLLVAVMLSARCTDERVNKTTPALFLAAPDVFSMSLLPREKLEKLIYSCGFYRDKAAHIISACDDICKRFNGVVPDNEDDLLSLSGVGRKTANVVMAVGFNKPGFAVDTHVMRVSKRLGIANANSADKVEKQLNKAIDISEWNKCHHLFIFHGRQICKSQRPMCDRCVLASLCSWQSEKFKNLC